MTDLNITFHQLDQITELAAKANFGGLQKRPKRRVGELHPTLQNYMIRVKRIYHLLSPRMSKLHPWMVVFELHVAQEVFTLLQKAILGRK